MTCKIEHSAIHQNRLHDLGQDSGCSTLIKINFVIKICDS